MAVVAAGISLGCSMERTAPRPPPANGPTPTAATASVAEPRRAPPPPTPTRIPLVAGTSTIGGRFTVSVDIEPYETFVDLRPLGAARPRWHWRPRSKTLSLEWAQGSPPATQVDLLRQMLTHLVTTRALDLSKTTLWMELSPWRYPAYSERLARFAAQDPKWRSVRTERGPGGARFYAYIQDTTRQRSLHPEFDAIFAPFGGRPRLDSVEKCLRSGVKRDRTTLKWLRAKKLPTHPPLPLGCLMTHFKIEPMPQATYLANAGVMVAVGSTKILFDPFFRNHFGIYELVPKDIETALFAGTPPFDDIDAIFISHHHGDHFSPEVVAAYLRAQPQVTLVAPAQAATAVLAIDGQPDLTTRVRAVPLTVAQPPLRLSLGAIDVEAVRIPHAGWPTRHRDVENIAYRVGLDGQASVVHLGDADPQRQHFERHRAHWTTGRRPSAAFPPYWFFGSEDGRSIVKDHLRGVVTIGVHVPADVPTAPEQRKPGLRAFDLFTQPGETRTLVPPTDHSAATK